MLNSELEFEWKISGNRRLFNFRLEVLLLPPNIETPPLMSTSCQLVFQDPKICEENYIKGRKLPLKRNDSIVNWGSSDVMWDLPNFLVRIPCIVFLKIFM